MTPLPSAPRPSHVIDTDQVLTAAALCLSSAHHHLRRMLGTSNGRDNDPNVTVINLGTLVVSGYIGPNNDADFSAYLHWAPAHRDLLCVRAVERWTTPIVAFVGAPAGNLAPTVRAAALCASLAEQLCESALSTVLDPLLHVKEHNKLGSQCRGSGYKAAARRIRDIRSKWASGKISLTLSDWADPLDTLLRSAITDAQHDLAAVPTDLDKRWSALVLSSSDGNGEAAPS